MAFQGTLFCIHGFLGADTDWDAIIPEDVPSQRMNLFGRTVYPFPTGLWEWAESVNLQAAVIRSPRVLLGYSLGGRIALHALLARPSLWEAAVVVSAHPGLASLSDRNERLKTDLNWGKRFEKEEWYSLLHAWNAQSVFGSGATPFERMEKNFSREALAAIMVGCSLGTQRDLRFALQSFKKPILWISGERDVKFSAVADEMAGLNPSFQKMTLAGAGHRVPWDDPQLFKMTLSDFLTRLTAKWIANQSRAQF